MHDSRLQTDAGTRVLLADIGGTNARFALADPRATAPLLVDSVRRYEVAAFASLGDAALRYLADIGSARGALRTGVFAVAGRVDGDDARITNHPWLVSRPRLCAALGLDDALLVNDFAAQAMSIPLLGASDLAQIGSVMPRPTAAASGDRTFAIIGPGTGLGVGALLLRDGRAIALETEGGHAGFAPATPVEAGILEQLSRDHGRVSNERLLSGPGLVNIHRALAAMAGTDAVPMDPADVAAGAQAGDARCMQAVDVFCAALGSAAGDLVLTLGAWDGVYLAGGVTLELLETLRHSGFRERFEHKGRFAPVMSTVPSLAVLHPEAGLLGAAAIARQRHGAAA
ncbi:MULTISPECIES: glucokinase [unclassified Luteimonas]